MKKAKKLPSARNIFVAMIMFKKAGAHQKPYKTSRRDNKVSLKKTLSEV